jgi:hypothetical protein
VLAAEHALELEPLDLPAGRLDVTRNARHRAHVALGVCHVEQICRIGEPALDAVEQRNYRFELRTLPAELLGLRRILPDVGILQRLADLGEPLALAIDVKDTPGEPSIAPADRG